MNYSKNLTVFCLYVICGLLSFASLPGETLYLKDGRILKGDVILNGDTITIITPGGILQFDKEKVYTKITPEEEKSMAEPNPVVQIETNVGTFKVELFEDECPNTTANFIHIAEQGMYDGALFHRVIKDFVIQGGDPGTKSGPPALWGTGGPGWKIKCELGPHKHERGALSMAHAGKDTGGSQFFVVLQRSHTAHLDGMHTVFGKVIEGMDTIENIESAPLGPGDRPVSKIAMTKVTVISKRDHEYIPVKN